MKPREGWGDICRYMMAMMNAYLDSVEEAVFLIFYVHGQEFYVDNGVRRSFDDDQTLEVILVQPGEIW